MADNQEAAPPLSGRFWSQTAVQNVSTADVRELNPLREDGVTLSSSPPSTTPPDTSDVKDSSEAGTQIKQFHMPSIDELRAQEVWNNCAVRSVASGVMGGGLGIFMGFLLGALDNPINQDQMTGRQQFVYAARQMGQRSWSSCKTFAIMGLVFSAVECVVEKRRAKHDMTNTVVAGCATGGAMSAKGGPKAACAGCAGFAAFSVLIEKILDRHD